MISFDLSDFADFFESKGTPTLAAYDVGTASAPSPTGSSISTATRSSTSRRSPTTRRRRSSPSRVTRSPRRRCPTSRRTLKTATTPTSRVVPPVAPEARRGPRVHLRRRVVRHRHRRQLPRRGGVRARRWNARCRRRDRREPDLGDVVHVMSGATVTDSTLERAVVFPNVTITDSGDPQPP